METKHHQVLLKNLSPKTFEEDVWITHSDEAIAYFEALDTYLYGPDSVFTYDRNNQIHKVLKSTGKGGFDTTIELPSNEELTIESIYYRSANKEEENIGKLKKIFN